MNLRVLLVLFSIFFHTQLALSQNNTVTISWSEPIEINHEGKTIWVPVIEGKIPSNGTPAFSFLSKTKNSNAKVDIQNVKTEQASKKEQTYLEEFQISIPTQFSCEAKCTNAGIEAYVSIACFPYVKIGNQIMRIVSFDYYVSPLPPLSINKDFATQSVLAPGSGSWYKIAVAKDGIYKIDKTVLESLGISITNLNPNHIHVYGNGEGSLPELNSVPYTDDLAQNAIQIFGGADNVFDNNDYILFYGFGAHHWYPNGLSEFEQRRNPYSDKSYYFININASTIPKIVQETDAASGIENTVFNTYDYRDVYENDLVSLVGGGKRWYGELFDVELTRSFNFPIPNLDLSSPVKFRSTMASNSPIASGTSQKYFNNGLLLFESTLPVSPSIADYNRSILNFTDSNLTSSTIGLQISVTRINANTLTYLDRILINCRRNLIFYSTQFGFRNLSLVDSSLISKYVISSFPANGFVWDVSNSHSPIKINGSLNSGAMQFWYPQYYNEFVASNGTSFFNPEIIGPIDPQNLHGLDQADYIIVTHKNFSSQADRLAQLHRDAGLEVHSITLDKIYNEFSSGAPDAAAIRKFAKMFHDRAIQNGSKPLKYLCLFGDGTYDPKDRIENNNNYVLTYQVDNSENHISALVTDDFFGMLDDNEAIYDSDLLDIGVGRILVSDLNQAEQQVDKIEHYLKNGSDLFKVGNNNCCLDDTSNTTFGDWRTKVVQVADDEENGYFIKNDTEPEYKILKTNHREINCDKLYLDAYPQQTSAGGQRYPDVLEAISDRIKRGALIVNYVGHGGEVGLAEERVVTIPQIQTWENNKAFTLFVSATCEFTKYDDPSRVSAGEWVSLNQKGGAIALMTTTRSVFFGVNTNVGLALFSNVFQRDVNNLPRTFGEIAMYTKNQASSSENKRSFTLIGDPALRLAFPTMNIVTDSINGNETIYQDTLKALSKVTIKGHIEDFNGALLNNFNGILIPTVFDKIKQSHTLGQDVSSPIINFELQRNVIYKGKASVNNGMFEFSFIVPKDIALNFGLGKLSYYADNNSFDAIGVDTTFMIGGIDTNGIDDVVGPEIEIFMNDETFIDGGITDESPVLFIKLFDESGINTVGNGIGHDITAILDNESSSPIVLNEYYSSDLNTYQSGQVKFPFENLEVGNHNIKVKFWDVNNNSSEATVRFTVQEEISPSIDKLYNYPNPFTTHTEFMMEHNQACDQLDVQIQIYTISGKLVKTINENVSTKGFNIRGIIWDGRDDFGDVLAKGVYIYRASLRNNNGLKAEKTEKLVILK